MQRFDFEFQPKDIFRNITDHFRRMLPWFFVDIPQYLTKHEECPDDVWPEDLSSGRLPDETDGHIRDNAPDSGRFCEKADDSDVWRDLMPAELWLGPYYSGKGETGPSTSGLDNDSERDQTAGHSSETGSGYVHVREYDRHQNGKLVHVRDYDRRHASSEHHEEHGRTREYDADYEQGHRDAYRELMNVKYRPGRFLNSEYRNSHPAYYRGYLHALVEIRQDPMYEKGFQDAVNGVVDPDNKMPYYLRGVEEYAGGDGLGLEETYPYARIPIGQLKRLGSLRGVLRDPRKLAELAKDVARRKAREMAGGTVTNWKPGEGASDKTTRGNSPTWPTIRRRHRINETIHSDATGKWTQEQLEQMKRNRAPERIDAGTGLREKMHLHHPDGREGENLGNYEERWESEHYDIHYPNRRNRK